MLDDKRCNNSIGGYSCYENLNFVKNKKNIFPNELKESDRERLFQGLEGIMPEGFFEQIWKMIWERYKIYENL